MVNQGIWVLAWLCLNPAYCDKPVVAPIDVFPSLQICQVIQAEMKKEIPDEVFVCIKEKEL